MASRVTPRASAASIMLRRSTDTSSDTSYTPAEPPIRLGSVHSSGSPRRPGDDNPGPPTDRRKAPGELPGGPRPAYRSRLPPAALSRFGLAPIPAFLHAGYFANHIRLSVGQFACNRLAVRCLG